MFVESAVHDRKEEKDTKIAELQNQNKLLKSSHTEPPAGLMTGIKEHMTRNEGGHRTTLLSQTQAHH